MRLRAFGLALICAVAIPVGAAPPVAPPSPPAPAPTAAPASVEASRVALIARVARSVVHIKGVGEPPPPRADPFSGLTAKQRDKMERRNPDIFGTMIGDRAEQPFREEGTGFVYDSVNGLALTASHIVARAKTVTVVLADGNEQPANILGIDPDTGVAIVKLSKPGPPALPLSNAHPRAGEAALVVGRMIPLQSTLATQGMVMGDARMDESKGDAWPQLADYVGLDNFLPNGGLGGSPVINSQGDVMGIVSAIFGRNGFGHDAMTLIVPVAKLRPVLDELAATGTVRRSQLGLNVECPKSVCAVTRLDPNGGAEAAELRVGDTIATLDGKEVTGISQLRRLVAAVPVGSIATLTIDRDGQGQIVKVMTTAARPPGAGMTTDK